MNMFLPILSPTAGTVLAIILIAWFVSIVTKKTSDTIINESAPKKTPFYDLPFIHIEKHPASFDDEVLFPYYKDGKYKAIARNKRLGKWKHLEADNKLKLELMLSDTFKEWKEEAEQKK